MDTIERIMWFLKWSFCFPNVPQKSYKILQRVVVFFSALILVLQAINIVESNDHLDQKIQSTGLLITFIMIEGKMYFVMEKFDSIQKIIAMLKSKEITRDTECTPEERRIYQQGANFNMTIFKFIYSSMCATLIAFITCPFLSIEPRFVVTIYVPFDTNNDLFGLVYFLQSLFCIKMGAITAFADNLFVALTIQIGVQIELLHYRIKRLKNCEGLRQNFNCCVDQHKWILNLVKNLLECFGTMVFGQCATSLLGLCQNMFTIFVTKDTGVFLFAIIYVVMGGVQIFYYSWFGNEITHKSTDLHEAAYLCSWTDFPHAVQKDLVFFMMRLKTPMVLRVGNIFSVGLQTFIGIVKWAYSSFNALNNIGNK